MQLWKEIDAQEGVRTRRAARIFYLLGLGTGLPVGFVIGFALASWL